MKTILPKPNEIKRSWYLIDAKGKTLGRFATEISKILQGKNHAYYSPQWDMGDYVIVINANDVVLTGNKEMGKEYNYHTQYPGGIKTLNVKTLREKNASKIIWLAVKRMLPKSRLASQLIKKLYVYNGPEHEQEAQKPQLLEL